MKVGVIILFVASLFLSNELSGQAQEKELVTSGGLVFGANSARITFLGERQVARVSPFFGVELMYHLHKRIFMNGMVLYAPKTSRFTGATIVKKNSLDFVLAPSYKIDDLTFTAGLVIEQISSISSRNITSSNVTAPISMENVPITNINGFVSAEVKANQRFNFFVQASIPTSTQANSTIGIGLKYKMNRRGEKQITERERARREAYKQINNLKEGVLLVRLKTSKNKIEALKKAGFIEKALKTERQQREQNLKIVSSFRRNYKFSEVQFFYSHFTKEVRRKKLENIFLDDTLRADSSIKVKGKPFLIAEYTEIEQDTAKYYSHTEYEVIGNFQTRAVDRYNGSTNFGFLALVIKNENFDQMVEPFPYYSKHSYRRIGKDPVQVLFGLPLVYSLTTPFFNTAVKRLDEKLSRFYWKNAER